MMGIVDDDGDSLVITDSRQEIMDSKLEWSGSSSMSTIMVMRDEDNKKNE